MAMNNIEKEKLIKADIESIENRVRHAFNQGYDLGFKDGQKRAKEPTTKNDLGVDAVSRQEVLYLIADDDLSMGQVVKGIHALPSVTPQEPKTGKWISTETKGVRYAFWCRYKCSLCGGLSDRTNFCPNCGARMVEPQESKENENIN